MWLLSTELICKGFPLRNLYLTGEKPCIAAKRKRRAATTKMERRRRSKGMPLPTDGWVRGLQPTTLVSPLLMPPLLSTIGIKVAAIFSLTDRERD